MSPVDALVARLDKVRETGPGKWRSRCPAHQSKGLTLSIAEADTGAALIHCFAGCGGAEVVSALGLELSDLYPRGNATYFRRYDHTPRKDYRGKLFALSHAATVVEIAAEHVLQGKKVTDSNLSDLRKACEAIRQATA